MTQAITQQLTQKQANYQSLAASGSFYIAFTGLTHEVVGPILFPWAPDWFGPIAWHGIGIIAMVLGLLLLAGTLRLIKFPVVPGAIFAVIGGLAATTLMAVKNQEFHFFAFSMAVIACGIVYFYRKANVQS